MFSPYYAWARRRDGRADPEHFCALNISLHGPRARWAMTERGRNAIHRDAASLVIGPSSMERQGDALVVRLDERGCPLPRRVRGTVRVTPLAPTGMTFALDEAARHRWSPLSPRSRVEVHLQQPNVSWAGDGYLDHNEGDRPMEDDFTRWHWSCARRREGAALLYDVTSRAGRRRLITFGVDAAGHASSLPEPPIVPLARTRWGVRRETRADGPARVVRTLVDAPFYARSVIETTLQGEVLPAVHESLVLERFRQPWVQAMLPFRVPRAF